MSGTTANERLKEARKAKKLRLGDASYLAHQQLPHVRCSHETIRRYEKDTPEEKWTPEIVLALTNVYDVDVASVSTIAAERLGRVVELYAPRDSNPEPSDSELAHAA